jgi:hypothetical protein
VAEVALIGVFIHALDMVIEPGFFAARMPVKSDRYRMV